MALLRFEHTMTESCSDALTTQLSGHEFNSHSEQTFYNHSYFIFCLLHTLYYIIRGYLSVAGRSIYRYCLAIMEDEILSKKVRIFPRLYKKRRELYNEHVIFCFSDLFGFLLINVIIKIFSNWSSVTSMSHSSCFWLKKIF